VRPAASQDSVTPRRGLLNNGVQLAGASLATNEYPQPIDRDSAHFVTSSEDVKPRGDGIVGSSLLGRNQRRHGSQLFAIVERPRARDQTAGFVRHHECLQTTGLARALE